MGQQAALGNLPDEGNHLILPAESARGDQEQLTSLLETSQSVCLEREIDRLPDSQRERRTFHHTLDAWSSKKLQSFPDGPVYAYTDRMRSGRRRQPPTSCSCRNLRFSPSLGSSSRSLRGVPDLEPLWRLPRRRFGRG